MRIISLLPSATEISYALGLEDQLLGVTFECDEPPRARRDNQIIVGGTDTSDMDPAEIDRVVRRRLAAGEDLYTLDAGALRQLQPELILTQDLCRVCAVPTQKVRDAAAQLGCNACVVTLDPYSLDEVLDSIADVAAATGVARRGMELIAALRARIDRVAESVQGLPRPRTAVLEWVDPPFGAGHWMPDMVTAAGGLPVACRPGQKSVPLGWDDIAAHDPQIVVVAPCGYGLDGATQQAAALVADRAFASRFPRAQVWAIDADGLMVRPGPRLVDGIEALAELMHPGVLEASGTGICRLR